MREWFRARRLLLAIGVGLAALGATGLSTMAVATATSHSGDAKLHPFTISSPNFRDGRPLPLSAEANAPAFGCNGQNQAPALRWTNAPAATMSFSFTMNDVDAPRAGGFHHWIVYDIPANVHELAGHGQNPFTEGTNSAGTTAFFGPCPPATGQVHHYVFTVYALSVAQVPGAHDTFEQLLAAIAPDVIGATSVIGTFRRPQVD
jgi:Raf kinase inhibitor-like YbhB/YbcL family protein